jgi:hypothetical protein
MKKQKRGSARKHPRVAKTPIPGSDGLVRNMWTGEVVTWTPCPVCGELYLNFCVPCSKRETREFLRRMLAGVLLFLAVFCLVMAVVG